MTTYVTGESLPDGTITHQITEIHWLKGKPFIKKSYCIVKGSIKKKNETKKAKVEKETKQAIEKQQARLDSFSKVEVQEEVL